MAGSMLLEGGQSMFYGVNNSTGEKNVKNCIFFFLYLMAKFDMHDVVKCDFWKVLDG